MIGNRVVTTGVAASNYGIQAHSAVNSTIQGNTIRNASVGVSVRAASLGDSVGNTVMGNIVENAVSGYLLQFIQHCIIVGNYSLDNATGTGFNLTSADDNMFDANQVTGAPAAVVTPFSIAGSAGTTTGSIRGNVFTDDQTLQDFNVTPNMTTVQRDALTPLAGMTIFNTTTSKHQGYDGVGWNDLY